jgi:formylglycine-generating enzyme required for sulfatase activity
MNIKYRKLTLPLLVVAALHPLGSMASTITIDTVYVGNINNPADPITSSGSVGYGYYAGKTEVTNAQYAAFLNAVDPNGTNPHSVYNTNMSSAIPVVKGGIDFNADGVAGGKYSPKTHFADKPVNYVSFYDAARFSNWVMTGNSEAGFYTFSGTNSIASQGVHGMGSYVALTDLDEWYKAAYHKNDGVTGNYYRYATGSDTLPVSATATVTGDIANPGVNVANYNFTANWNGTEYGGQGDELGNVTTVGSAGPGSASPYGTFDQGGNVLEWNDTSVSAIKHVMRGGSMWLPGSNLLSASSADYLSHLGGSSLGFRLTSLAPITAVPLPPAFMMMIPGLFAVFAGTRTRPNSICNDKQS